MIGRLLVVVAVVIVAVGLAGCGGSDKSSEPFVSAKQSMKVLYPNGEPGRFGRLTPLVRLNSDPLPHGDLAEYDIYPVNKDGNADMPHELAELWVLHDVSRTRRVTQRMSRTGACSPYNVAFGPDECTLVRVGNLLLIIGDDDGLGVRTTPADRSALADLMSKFGKPAKD